MYIFFIIFIPFSTKNDLIYVTPKCGVERVRYENIKDLYYFKWGKAVLIIIPPKEWPIKLNLKI